MKLTHRIREAVASATPSVQTRNRRGQHNRYSLSSDVGEIRPNRGNLDKYWDQYVSFPLVRRGIDIYTEDVTAPGYRVQCDDGTVSDKLETWLSNCAIVAGESGRDFSNILSSAVVQEEVRGTSLAEVVPTDDDEYGIYGFRPINVATVTAYTYDSQAVLVRPDDTESSGVELTERGQAAAYGQWEDGALAGPFSDKDVVHLSQDDVVKTTQSPDTSEIFGNSSIEPVSKEIDELERMLQDIGEAVHSKSYPHWVFQMGEPTGDTQNPRDGVWPDEEIKNYRDSHLDGEWSAGQKDFLPGDIEVETISSDVPDITDLLDWYVEEIVSSLPTPKYKLGFAGEINRDITTEQAPEYQRKVANKRRELENTFTPVIRRKAAELGVSDDVIDSIRLKIEEPREENPLERNSFDAEEFRKFATGLDMASGGDPERIVTPEEMRDMLGLPDRDASTQEATESELAPLDEDDENVQAQFETLYDEPAVPDIVSEESTADAD